MNTLSRKLAYLTVLAACGLLSGCGSTGVATVRTIELSPNTGAIDSFVSNTQVGVNLPYGTASTYTQVSDGNHTVEITPAGRDDTSLVKQTVDIYPNTNLTVIAVNPASSIAELVLTDNNTEPNTGDYKLRIVNASPSTASTAVDVYVTTPSVPITDVPPTFTNVTYQTAEAYLQLTAGSYQVRFTSPGTKTVLATTSAITPNAGDIDTVALADSPTGGSPLQAYEYTDATFSNNANQ
jgi:hypothetical protein